MHQTEASWLVASQIVSSQSEESEISQKMEL